MEINIKKKIFNVGDVTYKTSLSLKKNMHEPLEFLASLQGESIPWVIEEALEAYLIHAAQNGIIEWPKGMKPALAKAK